MYSLGHQLRSACLGQHFVSFIGDNVAAAAQIAYLGEVMLQNIFAPICDMSGPDCFLW